MDFLARDWGSAVRLFVGGVLALLVGGDCALAQTPLGSQRNPALLKGIPPQANLPQAGGEKPLDATDFVMVMGRIAGVQAVCRPAIPPYIRICVERVLPYWHELTGQASIDRGTMRALPAVWHDAFMRSYGLQSSARPPTTCAEVQEVMRTATVLRGCDVPSEAGSR